MAGDKRILIDLLLEAAAGRHDSSKPSALEDRIRAAFLLNSSHSPEACERVDYIEYDPNASPGLSVGRLALSKLFEGLSHRAEVPRGLANREPSLTAEEWRAAMALISKILVAFEPVCEGEPGK